MNLNISFLSIIFSIFFLVSCVDGSSQGEVNLEPTKVKIENETFNFGTIKQNTSVSTEFIIENIGLEPLIIRSAKAGCGCTVPEWPKEKIAVGDKANIKVTFNSGTRKGKINKNVTLVTNAIPSVQVLTITGTVVP
tara:strand:+ start:13824 stop:14231 length:408 start_codon:yes stop_codon:yes gene_type:complete